MYLGLNSSEISAIRALQSIAQCQPLCLDTEAVQQAVKRIIEVCPKVDELASAVGRIRKLHAQLLHPPPVISDANTATRASRGTLPEIRFTAILASAAVRIHAVVMGLSLEQAR